jgi:hypothetical protein
MPIFDAIEPIAAHCDAVIASMLQYHPRRAFPDFRRRAI